MRKIILMVLIFAILVSGCTKEIEESTKEILVKELKEEIKPSEPTYKYVTEKPTGWFRTGQEADIVLYATGFNESGGPLVLNHPSKVATDGKKLIVSDTWNHRVLIWNEIPTKTDQAPDLVLGQPDFSSNIGKLGASGMNWPIGVATDGERLLVADANNDRVLIWSEFPTSNGQPADFVLGAPDFDSWSRYLDWEAQRKKEPSTKDPRKEINWPWDVWTDGKRVAIASTTDSSVLIWNSFPEENNQPADLILGQPDFQTRFRDKNELVNWPIPLVSLMTPRSITSNGEYLAIGMYGGYGMYVWKSFPTENGQPADFVTYPKRLPDEPTGMVAGLTIDNGKLFVTSSHQVFVWNNLPMDENQKEDFRIGKLDPSLERGGLSAPEGVASDGQRLFVADTYQNRVLIFNKVPAEVDAKSDLILGQPDFGIDIFSSKNSFPNPFPYSNGKQLFVCSGSRLGLAIYRQIPDESKAKADIVISNWSGAELGDCGQITSDGKRLIIAARGSGKILIWNNIPEKNNQLPDIILGQTTDLSQYRHGIGKYSFNGPMGVTTDGTNLFVSDSDNNRILVWNQIPVANQALPDFVLGQPDFETNSEGGALNQLSHPVQISTDGKKLVVADQSNNRVLVWKELPTRSQQSADFEIKIINHSENIADLPPTAKLSMPAGVYAYNNSLFVADGNNRVLIWNSFPENGLEEPDIVLGQPDFVSQYKTNSKDGLFMPHYLSFDGSYLWVGEMKFSNRLLRFSVEK